MFPFPFDIYAFVTCLFPTIPMIFPDPGDYMTTMKMFDPVYTCIGEPAMKYPNGVVPG